MPFSLTDSQQTILCCLLTGSALVIPAKGLFAGIGGNPYLVSLTVSFAIFYYWRAARRGA